MNNETETYQNNLPEEMPTQEKLLANRSQLVYEFGETEFYRLRMMSDLKQLESRAQSLVDEIQKIDVLLSEMNKTDGDEQ